MKRRLRTPGPALVISLIALFVALGGTTYAATSLPKNSVGTAQLKKGAVTKAKINKKTIKSLKGNRGPAGAQGATGAQGPAGPAGPAGAAGSAVAYAHIMSDGTLDATHSKNVSAASTVSTGIYCLKVSVAVNDAVSTVDAGNNGGFFGSAVVILSGQDPSGFIPVLCPAGDNALVATFDTSGANANDSTWTIFN